MRPRQPTLIWDIDGTLLTTGGRGFRPFIDAINEFFSGEIKADYSKTHGLTDYETINFLLGANNIAINQERIEKALSVYSQNLNHVFTASPPEVLPGIIEVLDFVSNKTSWRQFIGTGNCLDGAKAKLSSTGLLEYFEESNLFCASQNANARVDVISNARNSLKSIEIGIVVGDTPADISCAKECGLKVIAVATGAFGAHDLQEHGADYVLERGWTLGDFNNKVNSILNKG